MPLIRWLNSIIAGLGSPCPSRVVCTCNSPICRSLLESKHVFCVCFIKFIHASTSIALMVKDDDENACSMIRLLQKVLNLSETKLPPKSDIIFSGTLYSAKMILHVDVRLSYDRSSIFLMIGNLL